MDYIILNKKKIGRKRREKEILLILCFLMGKNKGQKLIKNIKIFLKYIVT
jgi:hypothetical protein